MERLAALMCYIQLSLWNVPAEVIVGNTLSWEIREVWYTPAHHLGMWKHRLSRNAETLEVAGQEPEQAQAPAPEPQPHTEPEDTPAAPVTPTQLGFDF